MHIYDIHIKNGEIIDGTGAPKFKSDIVIDKGKIIGVFPPENADVRDIAENHFLSNFKAKQTFDAKNKIISPGFIDVHTHDDDNVFLDPTMSSKISQGVTTCIAGNCGISLAPFSYKGDVPAPIALLGKLDVFRFPRVKDYKDEFKNNPSTVNLALLTGHSMLRVEAMNGEYERAASSHEISKMVNSLETALEDGSIGLSTGLAYPAANDAPTSEIIELAKILPKFDGIFTTHMRNEAVDVIKSVNETIEISSTTKVRTVISHHKCAGRENWGKSQKTLKLIQEAKKNNFLDLDCYPYTASSTMLLKSFVKRADKVLVTWSDNYPDVSGQDLKDLAKEFGLSIDEAIDKLYPAGAIYFQMDDQDLNRILQFPGTMIGSDGIPGDRHPHPRLWGTFPRVLGKYSREMKLFPLEEAVYKMTGKSAEVFGLKRRGTIDIDNFADLVIFNPDTVIDKASYTSPKLHADGIESVFINGELVWENDKPTENRPGMFLSGKKFN
ncbi:D-aminoacylase [Alphaproteobacteria bacterium]|nr:D-aminoacylase [Alphaproteobacteria bacterium]